MARALCGSNTRLLGANDDGGAGVHTPASLDAAGGEFFLEEGLLLEGAGAWAGSCLKVQEVPRLHIPRMKNEQTGLSPLLTVEIV